MAELFSDRERGRVLPAAISLSRPSGFGPEYITVRIEDRTSSIEFVELRIKLDDFARMMTGLAYVDAEMVTRGLENVGKVREYVRAQVFISDRDYANASKGTYDESKKGLAKWLVDNHARDGWETDTYLGSQGSIGHVKDGKLLNFGYFRYVDKTD